MDALPDDAVRHGNHQLHVYRVQRLRIDPPMQFVALVSTLFLRSAVVGRCDEAAFGAVYQAYRFGVRLDILENIFNPLDGKIVSHHAYQPSLRVFYLKRMGGYQRLCAGAYIWFRPIAIAVATKRTRVPVAHIVIQAVRTVRSSDGLAVKTVCTREIVAFLAVIHTRRKLDVDIVYMRIAVEFRTGRFQQFTLTMRTLQHISPHLICSVVKTQ